MGASALTRPPRLEVPPRTEPCRVVLDYWTGLRGGRLMPGHAEVDPIDLARHLAHVAVFEVQSPQTIVCRLAGTAYRASLGFELTGRNIMQLYAAGAHRAASYRLQMMVTRPCAAIFELPLRFSSGFDRYHEILLLPLAPAEAAVAAPLLVGMAPLEPLQWLETAVLPQLQVSPSFRFIDIGAGMPDSAWPPPEFAPL